ncbi:arginyl-tRNA--protein transferase 2-like isoform X2 [Alnus glutinosa]|uniref:arginyl-tRNA--protein transferase 2-like isoform X2 n=1 Tax=Alnus glutinosa TaxID=3517 RepID=UPI002D793765|nr:arginyl-tRNA--protein transferase 2-like isoform X2 [Alnus glutinosa]
MRTQAFICLSKRLTESKKKNCLFLCEGLWADSLTVDDYQDLLDRGWRRSGSYLYQPEMERTCCPSYTIRLRAADFIPSKEQLRVSRRMQRFLDGTLNIKKPVELMEDPNTSKDTCSCAGNEVSSLSTKESLSSNNGKKNEAEQILNYLSDQIDNAVFICKESWKFLCDIQLPKAFVKKVSEAKRKLLVEGSEDLLYSSNIAFQIAAAIRQAQSCDNNKLRLSGHSAEENELSPKLIAEKLARSLSQLAETSRLLIRACNGHINFYSASKHLLSDRSVQVHTVSNKSAEGCASKKCCLEKSSEQPLGKKQRLEIRMKRSSFEPEEFALYKKYQMKVHNDTPDHVTESSYQSFLVDTPLVFVPPTGDGTVPHCGFGSFHQQYLIDGRLVAVGVIDILPRCLSSKYLFWDPDFAFLSPGKYSALQEIDWIRENKVHCPSLRYYYLGYYIHSCDKMRYKAAYHPSELLCPLRYRWIPYDIARPLLDRKLYVVLSDFAILQNGESSPSRISENVTEVQHDDICQDSNDLCMEEDEEMIDPDCESSDDESGPESSDKVFIEIDDGGISNILIGLERSRLRYKDLPESIERRRDLESRLHRYMRVVGAELSERMVYSLG